MDNTAFSAQFDYMEMYEMAYNARTITKPSSIPNDSLSHLLTMVHNNEHASEPFPELNTATPPPLPLRPGHKHETPMPWTPIGCTTPLPAAPARPAPRPLQPVLPAPYGDSDDQEQEAIDPPLHRTPSETGTSYFPPLASPASTPPCPDHFGCPFEEYLHELNILHRKRLPVGHPDRIEDLGVRTVCSVELGKRRFARKKCPWKKMVRKVQRWRDGILKGGRRGGREGGVVGFL